MGTLDIIERLDRLERENRRLKRGALALLVIGGSVVLMGQARRSSRIVEAQRFVIVDPAGNTRAELANLPAGTPALRFFNQKGNVDALVSGTGVALYDGTVNTAHFAEGGLTFGTRAGETWFSLGQYSYDPHFSINDPPPPIPHLCFWSHGKVRVELTAEETGPALSMKDNEGFEARLGRTGLQIPSTGESRTTSAASLTLLDKSGKVIWSAPE